MKKIGLIVMGLLCLLCVNKVSANDPEINIKPSMNLIPPSPTAFKFSTYGNISLNNNTGRVNYSVPLYTIQNKDITFPISLNYSSNGVRIDDMAANAGVDWILNAGGVISRVVRGLPDGHNGGSFHYSNKSLNEDNLLDIDKDEAVEIAEGQFTAVTQRDWYSFNVNGLSGSFYEDDNKEFLIESDEYVKIEKKGLNFTLVDKLGNIYDFEANETTTLTTHSSNGGMIFSPQAITAWYLTKLTTPTGNVLKFSYLEHHNSYTLDYSTHLVMGSSQMMYNDKFTNKSTSSTSRTGMVQGISKIEFSDGYITFVYAGEFSASGNYNIRRRDGGSPLVKEIKIYSFGNTPLPTLLKTVELSYTEVKTNNFESALPNHPDLFRYFLDSISLSDSQEKIVDKYMFEYNKRELLPKRLSSLRDKFGYFNNNSGIFDKNMLKDYDLKSSMGEDRLRNYFDGDIEVNPSVVDYGMLTKVTYPTKGYTTFSYQPNETMRDTTERVKEEVYSSAFLQISRGFEDDGIGNNPINLKYQQAYVDIEVTNREKYTLIRGVGNPYRSDGTNRRFEFNVIDLDKDRYVTSGILFLSNQDGRENNKEFKANLDPGRYRVSLKFTEIWDIYNIMNVHEMAYLQIRHSFREEEKEVTVNKKVYAGGVRIHEITDNAGKEALTNKKTYHYSALENIGSSKTSLQYKDIPKYKRNITPSLRIAYDDFGLSVYEKKYYDTFIFSTSNLPLIYNSRSSEAYYTHITEVTEGNGAVEKIYMNEKEEEPRYILYGALNPPGSNTYNGYYGRLETENFYKETTRVSKEYKLVKKRRYMYGSLYPEKLLSVFLERTYTPYQYYAKPGSSSMYQICSASDMVYISYYYDCVNNVRPYGVEEELFDDNQDIIFSQKTNKSYLGKSDYFNLKTISTTINSGNTSVDYFEYPRNRTESYMSELVKEGRVGIPVYHTKTLKKSGSSEIILESEQILYDKFELKTKKTAYLPGTINTFVKSILADQTSILRYDIYGNPMHILQADGAEAVYLWSYKGQYPIAEIKNATYTNVETAAKSAFGVSSVDALSDLSGGSLTQLNNLSKNELLKGALITTYTYTPLVGMTSMTAPSGRTIFYNYDSFGRLDTISVANKSKGKDLIETYKYHYVNSDNDGYPDINSYILLPVQEVITHSEAILEIVAKGGSNKFTYAWEILDPNNNLDFKTQSEDKILKYIFKEAGTYTIKSTVTDILSGKTDKQTEKVVVTTANLNTEKQTIGFSNIQTTSNITSNSKEIEITAEIDCPVEVELNITTAAHIPTDSNGDNSHTQIRIGIMAHNYYYTSSDINKSKIKLSKGKNYFLINVYSTESGEGHAKINIDSMAENAYCVLGGYLSLDL